MTVTPINLGFVYAYLIKGDDKCILVDAGFPGQGNKILAAVDKSGVPRTSISLIVITHADPDHYGSSGLLRKVLNVPVLVHRLDHDIVRTGINREYRSAAALGSLMKFAAQMLTKKHMRHYTPFEPDIVMDGEQLSLASYGIDAYLLHTPGETPGSISVVLNNKTIIAGDLIGGLFPHSAIPAYAPFSDNIEDVKMSLKKLRALHPTTIYTGHSKPIVVSKHLKKLASMTA